MTLIDSSVWINHFRNADSTLLQLLAKDAAGVHPFVIGEIATGSIKDRKATLDDLRDLPRVLPADEAEVYYILEKYQLWSTGLSWIDLHLLSSAAVAGWSLMTADTALRKAAAKAGIPLA